MPRSAFSGRRSTIEAYTEPAFYPLVRGSGLRALRRSSIVATGEGRWKEIRSCLHCPPDGSGRLLSPAVGHDNVQLAAGYGIGVPVL